jgi:hypothetical protein
MSQRFGDPGILPSARRRRSPPTCGSEDSLPLPHSVEQPCPYAVAKGIDDFREGEISVRFKPLEGRVDQGAGILFNLKPNGDYLTVRANCLENNIVLWKFENGKRSSVKWVRNTPTATRQWHDLKVRINGTKVEGYLDGKLYLEHTLGQPISGRIGLWSKADSHMYFADYTVAAAN